VLIFALVSGIAAWLVGEVVLGQHTLLSSLQSLIVCGSVFVFLNWIGKPFTLQERELLAKLAGPKLKWMPF
jgi:ABC-type uncharacterized transport system permease subunit